MRRIRVAVALLLPVLASACQDLGENVSGLDPFYITRVEVVPGTDTVFVRDTLSPSDTTRFVAIVTMVSGERRTNVPMVWSSSDSSVAVVDQTGLARGVAPGTATVTASAGRWGTATLVVLHAAAQVVLTPETASVFSGDTIRVSARAIDPTGATARGIRFTWTAQPTSVATVDAAGLVRTLAPGSVRVIATATSGVADTTTITVLPRSF